MGFWILWLEAYRLAVLSDCGGEIMLELKEVTQDKVRREQIRIETNCLTTLSDRTLQVSPAIECGGKPDVRLGIIRIEFKRLLIFPLSDANILLSTKHVTQRPVRVGVFGT